MLLLLVIKYFLVANGIKHNLELFLAIKHRITILTRGIKIRFIKFNFVLIRQYMAFILFV